MTLVVWICKIGKSFETVYHGRRNTAYVSFSVLNEAVAKLALPAVSNKSRGPTFHNARAFVISGLSGVKVRLFQTSCIEFYNCKGDGECPSTQL